MSRIASILGVLVVFAIVAIIVATGIIPRMRAQKVLREETARRAEPVVTVFHASRAAASEEVVLPGTMQAFVDAPIFARTSGYLKSWSHDIGSRVKKGDLLAVIESPEVDQQLQQAKHDLTTSEANLALAQTTATRYVDLFKTDSVAKQDVDNAVQSAAAQSATVKASQANVDRLQQMVDFEKVYAPFDGVITARNTDIGQLIDSGRCCRANLREQSYRRGSDSRQARRRTPGSARWRISRCRKRAYLSLPTLPREESISMNCNMSSTTRSRISRRRMCTASDAQAAPERLAPPFPFASPMKKGLSARHRKTYRKENSRRAR